MSDPKPRPQDDDDELDESEAVAHNAPEDHVPVPDGVDEQTDDGER
ncbi:hypothetical protein [Cellulomonas edaphi]|uniref:Uncharacterized protein n=1 Tax=Cellulomonas edaphi TaxID=3053468 RepID=A0ABT7S794_9CELL|nr:hypothetical protein [Cellulomons edaphi]MDM7831477.1 hypothetical protein [Cellulomons edaphi]